MYRYPSEKAGSLGLQYKNLYRLGSYPGISNDIVSPTMAGYFEVENFLATDQKLMANVHRYTKQQTHTHMKVKLNDVCTHGRDKRYALMCADMHVCDQDGMLPTFLVPKPFFSKHIIKTRYIPAKTK